MNPDWQSFLEQSGATIKEGEVTHFGEPAAELRAALDSDILADLSHFALVRVSGDDRRDFLQGQFSNDIRLADAGASQLSSYCSPKGRMLAIFRLFERENTFYLQMPAEIMEPTVKRLGMFILMSKVVLEDASDELVRFGLSGPNAEKILGEELGSTLSGIDDSLTHDGITLIRLPGLQPRFEIISAAAQAQALWQALVGKAKPVGSDVWSLLDIQAGIPTLFEGTVEAFVPQMVNLHLVNGLSFKKGCYPGQEIVARMQYLGKLKRRMYLAHADSDERPSPGDALFSAETQSGQGTGTVVQAAAAPEGGYDLLVVAEIKSLESGEVHLESENGPVLTFRELPYPFEQEESA